KQNQDITLSSIPDRLSRVNGSNLPCNCIKSNLNEVEKTEVIEVPNTPEALVACLQDRSILKLGMDDTAVAYLEIAKILLEEVPLTKALGFPDVWR
ncbi:Uncharacterized protein APZ42_004874, partial [Daphnia magna]